MKKRLLLFLFMSCILGHINLFAQTHKVTGIVTDSQSGEPLPGAKVTVKTTTIGTVTDLNGIFTVEAPNANATLEVSFIGYLTANIAIQGQSNVNVKLNADVQKLDEVVVIGYGSAKRGNLTTALTSVSAKEMERTVNTTIEQAIQGRTAGVYITQNSGQPGGGMSVNIRGVNSINGTNEPLYVIDNVQIAGSSISSGTTSSSNPLAGINPSDIENIQILQGPSATAMYGSRATNGVVLITTKQGKSGEAKVNYSYQYGLQESPKHLNLMNLRQYAQMVNEVEGSNKAPIEFKDPSLLGNGTDWQNELFKESAMYRHQISVSGGGEKNTYYLSGEYLNQDGIAAGSGFDRYSFRLNMTSKPMKWLTLGANVSFNQTKEKLATSDQSLIVNALTLTPQIPVKNLDGTWGGGETSNSAEQYSPVNPIAIANLTTNNNTKRQLLGGINMDLTLLKGLVFRTTFNTNMGYSNSLYFLPTYSFGWAVNKSATLTDGAGNNTYWCWNQMLEYNKQIEKHNFDLLVSHESQASTWKSTTATRSGYLVSNILDLEAGNISLASNSGGQGDWAEESYFGQLNYNYAERYIIVASIRKDGSSNFGADNRWGVFPAASLAWRITKEPWFPEQTFVNEFKIRLETGTTGNQGSGGIYSNMGTAATQWGTGFIPTNYSNPGLKWEQTKTYNIGTNISLLANRIQLEFDYYKKNTDNLLMTNPLPYYLGTNGTGSVSAPTVNIGALENKGWGITIITTNINTKDFKWESNFNISGFKTKITKFYSDAAFVDRTSWWMSNWAQRSAVGEAPWLFRGYIQDGIFQSVDEINNSAVPVDNSGARLATGVNQVWVGDVKYKDISGPEGIPDGVINTYDQTNMGNPWPKYSGGFTNTFSYKGFELSILLTFQKGNDVFNYLAWQNTNPHNVYLGRNMFTDAENYAKLTTDEAGSAVLSNPGTNLPRLSISNGDVNGNWNRFTNRWVEDGSYLKIKNISLAYTFPTSFVAKQKIVRDAKIIISAQNVATITGYKGYDPEIGSYVGANASASNQAIGVDYGRYPLTPIYTFNLILNF
jgi:TonB-dependent starch-binding outer membrane protein SusC